MCVSCVCIDLIQHASPCFPGYHQNHLMALVLFCQKAGMAPTEGFYREGMFF